MNTHDSTIRWRRKVTESIRSCVKLQTSAKVFDPSPVSMMEDAVSFQVRDASGRLFLVTVTEVES